LVGCVGCPGKFYNPVGDSGVNISNNPANYSYAKGEVSGNLMNITAQFGPFKVSQYGGIAVNTASNFPISNQNFDGMVGFSFFNPDGYPLLMQLLKDQG